MKRSGPLALVVLLALAALATGYVVARAVVGDDRTLVPVIDLDDLPPSEDLPTTTVPDSGAEVVPPPTVLPPATTPAPPPAAPPGRTLPPPVPSDDDDDGPDDDDDDDDDVGEVDDD